MTIEELREMREKQLVFDSANFGLLYFVPVKKDKNTCKHCMLYRSQEECLIAPCTRFMRVDMQEGYFTIQQMPEES